ncbi:MAG: hypothetical protein K6E76_02300 [Patescibacteria group bacterium]|nr:hypothetical protein [Patescibacteria group bacterium]
MSLLIVVRCASLVSSSDALTYLDNAVAILPHNSFSALIVSNFSKIFAPKY